MKIRLLLAAALVVAACRKADPMAAELKRWEGAVYIFAAVDGPKVEERVMSAAIRDGRAVLERVKPPYLRVNVPGASGASGVLVAYSAEALIPSGTSFTPMTPLQAVGAGQSAGGICMDLGADGNCRAVLFKDGLARLQEALLKAGKTREPLPFSVIQRR
jgi:hypothetical protein